MKHKNEQPRGSLRLRMDALFLGEREQDWLQGAAAVPSALTITDGRGREWIELRQQTQRAEPLPEDETPATGEERTKNHA